LLAAEMPTHIEIFIGEDARKPSIKRFDLNPGLKAKLYLALLCGASIYTEWH
jgi:hypothetical protein